MLLCISSASRWVNPHVPAPMGHLDHRAQMIASRCPATTYGRLSDLIRSGKVRAIGASQTPAPDIIEARHPDGLERAIPSARRLPAVVLHDRQAGAAERRAPRRMGVEMSAGVTPAAHRRPV